MNQVIGVVRECDRGRVWIELDQSGCGRCSEPGGCGGVSIARQLCPPKRLSLVDTLGLRRGDRVVVAVPEKVLQRSATAVYVVPLVLGFAAALLGRAIFGQPGAPLSDIAGFVIGVAGGWLGLARLRLDPAELPVLVAKDG